MKQTITHSRWLWIEDLGRHEYVKFVIEFEPDDLPHKMFTKALHSKSGTSKVAGGAIAVRLQK